jgi:molybdopterin molybdotransferase
MSLLPFDDALARLLAAARPIDTLQILPLLDIDRRVLAADVTAAIDVPGFNNSAMDGYAVNLADFAAPPASLPVVQRIAAGEVGQPLAPNSAARIFTGAPVPPGTNAVVPQEEVEAGDGVIALKAAVREGQHIRYRGEDIAAGSLLLPRGAQLNPQRLALAASVGLPELPVRARLKVGVLFTGDELTRPGQPLPAGGIYDSNRYAIVSLLHRLGAVVNDYGNVPDDRAATEAALREAAHENDVVISVGGVSVGEEDHVKAAVQAQGHLDLWKIAMKPGKPLAFGRMGEADFIGLPGNPVSAFLTFCLLARPFLLARMGARDTSLAAMTVPAAFSRSKPDSRREFLRARLALDASGFPQAILHDKQGSAAMTGLVWADGLVDVPAGATVASGDPVRFLPLAAMTQ